MAVKSTILQTSLILKYKDGLDAKGKEVIKQQRFSNIKTTAADQDIYDVSKEIEKLLGKTLNELVKQDQNAITVTA
ncbi:DUF1659 domain-containing protein [Clostridium autoethanogenum]|uniref:DUF1659 domain-containing protein n=1 Tax=Clostridium autoethanogenum DSM 10061 TaxID=1341692 RepID=A0ABN4BGK4_9CLOT|nr:DUF1659 domain-containing protein [Clostridium autoethanogenum]AGY76803.1 DUF1659 domain-containing protein [Clostridium autoethanogenum DSM 10061]ALU36957.1 hypothetical protein CLAU_2529 [Clostridium autoethanogenum DSM 10061]OVY50353.1 hypothetical protein WX72_02425 [Clostridium autoethanogenum]